MIVYRLEALVPVELDIEAAFEWYQAEEMNLGFSFLEEVRTATLESLIIHSLIPKSRLAFAAS